MEEIETRTTGLGGSEITLSVRDLAGRGPSVTRVGRCSAARLLEGRFWLLSCCERDSTLCSLTADGRCGRELDLCALHRPTASRMVPRCLEGIHRVSWCRVQTVSP